jgi:hypothetical protein
LGSSVDSGVSQVPALQSGKERGTQTLPRSFLILLLQRLVHRDPRLSDRPRWRASLTGSLHPFLPYCRHAHPVFLSFPFFPFSLIAPISTLVVSRGDRFFSVHTVIHDQGSGWYSSFVLAHSSPFLFYFSSQRSLPIILLLLLFHDPSKEAGSSILSSLL